MLPVAYNDYVLNFYFANFFLRFHSCIISTIYVLKGETLSKMCILEYLLWINMLQIFISPPLQNSSWNCVKCNKMEQPWELMLIKYRWNLNTTCVCSRLIPHIYGIRTWNQSSQCLQTSQQLAVLRYYKAQCWQQSQILCSIFYALYVSLYSYDSMTLMTYRPRSSAALRVSRYPIAWSKMALFYLCT